MAWRRKRWAKGFCTEVRAWLCDRRSRSRRVGALLGLLTASGCVGADGGDTTATAELAAVAVEASSTRHPVGTVRIELDVDASRRVPVQLWYPAVEAARAEAEAGRPVVAFEPPGLERWILRVLTLQAPSSYVQRTMHAADAPAVAEAETPLPLVVFSHCADCMRFSSFSVAERLASLGFVVAAPDHVGGTYYDQLAGRSVGADLAFLDQRRADIEAVLDALLDPGADGVPDDLRGRLDADRVGMVGHSMGALTTGYVAATDARIRAIALLAMASAAPENDPLFGPLLNDRFRLSQLTQPALYVLAQEDLLGLLGINDFIHYDFEHHPREAWLATMADAGHFSVSDLCGLDDYFMQGCGSAFRVTQFLVPFTFIDNARAMQLTSDMVAAVFAAEFLDGDPQALAGVVEAAADVLTLDHHTP